MEMRRYYLSYFYENGYKTVDLTNVDVMKNKNPNDLSAIDSFTMNFSTANELRNYLKGVGLISEDVISDFCITSIRVNNSGQLEQVPIYNGNVILLSNSMGYISLEYARKLLEEHKFNPKFMLLLAENYREKYMSNKKEMYFNDSQIVAVFEGIERIVHIMAEISYKNLDSEIKDEYNDLLRDLKTIVFYRYAILYDEGVEDFVFRRNFDKAGDYVTNYKGLRNFVINTLNLLKTLSIEEEKKHKKSEASKGYTEENSEDYENEEFLYRKDYNNSNDEILRDYNPSEGELMCEIDGHDYNRMLTKKELASALNTYATMRLRKRPREDGGTF